MELLAMYWVYGVGKFYRDLENIQGFSPGLRLKSHITVIYGTISPALISVRHIQAAVIGTSIGETMRHIYRQQ